MLKGRGALFAVIMAASVFLGIIFLRAFDYQGEFTRLNREFLTLEDRMTTKAGNWVTHLENRVNRASQTQDEYQASTSRRIDLLEEKIRRLEREIQNQEERLRSLKTRAGN